MTSQEQHVLDEFYKNAVMGADATSTILPKADHPDLRQELCKQLEFYQSRKEEIRSQMQQAHVQPVQQSDMAKFWANANIQLHCLGGASANEIAKADAQGHQHRRSTADGSAPQQSGHFRPAETAGKSIRPPRGGVHGTPQSLLVMTR